MKTANQNFNAKNFGVIYNLLNRKGKVDITKMSCEFQEIVRQIKECRNELRALRQKEVRGVKTRKNYSRQKTMNLIHFLMQGLKNSTRISAA